MNHGPVTATVIPIDSEAEAHRREFALDQAVRLCMDTGNAALTVAAATALTVAAAKAFDTFLKGGS